MPSDPKVNLFISYAHKDKSYFDVFHSNLKSQCDWDIWTDRNIEIGTNWFESIQQSMQQSDGALLLISPDFLSSEFISENEFNKFLELKMKKPSFVFVPVFLRDCKYTRWNELSKLQMFVAYGDEYGVPDKKGQLIPFAKLCRFDINNQLVPNDNIDTYIKNLVTKTETELKIARSGAENNGDKSRNAKEIDKLRTLKNIFLSLPATDAGNEIRENFIFSVDRKIKYENPDWPYEIKPGFLEAKELSSSLKEDPEKIISKLPDDFIYSILIIASAEDLQKLQESKQYELAKKTNDSSDINRTILWFLNAEAKAELDKLPDSFNLELKMLPSYVGSDTKNIFKLIDDFDKAREKKINQLTEPFSSAKQVYLFYDIKKDNDNELRIALKKEMEAKKITITDLADLSIEEEKKAIEECNGAIIFYGPNSDSIWYKMRERIILKAKNIRIGAVCVDGSPETEIERKVDRDVSVTKIMTIKGKKEFDDALNIINSKLQDQ